MTEQYGTAPASEATENPDKETIAELRNRVLGLGLETHIAQQIDLNDEKNIIDGLEDSALVAHMEHARHRLAEQHQILNRLPRREELRTEYIGAMGNISEMIRSLETVKSEESESVEKAYLLVKAVAYCVENQGTPVIDAPTLSRAARAEKSVIDMCKYVAVRGKEIAVGYEALQLRNNELKNKLFTMRRQVEKAGDGLLELIEASEEDRRRQREYLSLASKAEVSVRHANAPAETLGERLLASEVLPEEMEKITDRARE
jgi:hypothetical protein